MKLFYLPFKIPVHAAFMAGIVLFSVSCEERIQGQFGFSSTDDRGIDEPERSRLVETEFRLSEERLHFYSHETIWWIYRIEAGRYRDEDLLMILYADNNTPSPVEVEMRRVKTMRTGFSAAVIRDYFRELDPGRYILAIAQDSVVADSVKFEVHQTPDETGGEYDPAWDKEEELPEENPPDESF